MSTLAERIAELMQAQAWSVGDVAEHAGVSSSAVSQWLNGNTQTLKLEPAIRLERASGWNALWLASGKGPKEVAIAKPVDGEADAVEAGSPRGRVRRVPIVGTAKLGDDGFYEDLSPVPGAGDGHIEIATDDPNAYGLRVRGQSMFPAIRDGWYVLIEPNGQPVPGEYVLLKLRNGQRMVKELLQKRPMTYEVMSVNGSQRHTFEMDELESVQAVGAVVSPSKWRPD